VAELWKVYDEMAPWYAAFASDSPYNAHYDRPSMLELLGDVDGLRVLDAACGPGLYAEELVRRGGQVTCFDASAPMVQLARERLGERTVVHQLQLGEPLPFEDRSFDLVVCALAIHYVADRAAALRELHRVLDDRGALVLSTQHPTQDWLRKGGSYFDVAVEHDVWRPDSGGWAVSYWREPLSSLTDACADAGFLIERLVEPRPAESMLERWPHDYEHLRKEPGFLNLRLVKR
jgi:SAM-dependent methyltransferase